MAKEEAKAPKSEKEAGGRKIMLKDPKTGKDVARVDVIKELYAKGTKRGEIRKILKETYNHDVAYQIVFAATKPVKEGGAKEEKAAKAA